MFLSSLLVITSLHGDECNALCVCVCVCVVGGSKGGALCV
jgi:hypothetical protein